ncbi:hypothetical protein ACFRAQ_03490 [Nocardia sp. NPDC056611]|uniref:hypothetical protein n=1 Tax=Nocardia sp. NPDC056611 TaxID=3345877 RepID=UPI00366E1BFC
MANIADPQGQWRLLDSRLGFLHRVPVQHRDDVLGSAGFFDAVPDPVLGGLCRVRPGAYQIEDPSWPGTHADHRLSVETQPCPLLLIPVGDVTDGLAEYSQVEVELLVIEAGRQHGGMDAVVEVVELLIDA